MVGNVTIQGQIVGTATFDGAKISAVVTIMPPINATVNFGGGISTIEQFPDPISDSSNIYGWIRSALLTGLSAFTDVAIVATDTILQAFAKLQGQVNAIKVRLGVLEDNYLLSYVVPSDTSLITLTLDKNGKPLCFVNNDEIVVQIIGKTNRTDNSGYIYLRPNNVSSSEYCYNGNARYVGFIGYAAPIINQKWTLSITTDSVHCLLQSNTSLSDYSSYNMRVLTLFTKLVSDGGSVVSPITRLDLITSATIYAGTEIIIKKK